MTTTYFSDVWASPDGETWNEYETENHWEARIGHCGTVYQNRPWIIGGYHSQGSMYTDKWYWKKLIIVYLKFIFGYTYRTAFNKEMNI